MRALNRVFKGRARGDQPTLPAKVKRILRKYGATLLMPGPAGILQYGFQPGNYRESTGQNLAAVDQQVGLVVDAARSPGPELVTGDSSTFDTGVGSWVKTGAALLSASGGIASVTNGVNYSDKAELSISESSGKTLAVEVDVWVSSGTARVSLRQAVSPFAEVAFVLVSNTARTRLRLVGLSPSGNLNVQIVPWSGSAGQFVYFDTVSVRELHGIHASQATSGYQPYLRQVPKKLGPELVSNGAFDTADGWSMGAGWDISGGAMNHTAPSTLTSVLAVATQAGKIYQCSYSITSQSAAGSGVSLRVGSTNLTIRNAVGTYSETMTQAVDSATVGFIARGGSGDWLGSIDNLSVREVLEWTYAWQFDGNDDRLPLTSLPLSSGDDFYQAFALRCATSGANKTFADLLTNPTTGTRLGCLRINGENALQVVHANDAGWVVTTAGRTVTDGQQLVVEALRVGASHTVFADGAADIQTTLSGNYATTHATIGARGAGTADQYLGYIHGSIICKGSPSEGERAILRKFLAQLQGRSL